MLLNLIDDLRAQVAILEPCVRHYADPANWDSGDRHYPDLLPQDTYKPVSDTGSGADLAREALGRLAYTGEALEREGADGGR